MSTYFEIAYSSIYANWNCISLHFRISFRFYFEVVLSLWLRTVRRRDLYSCCLRVYTAVGRNLLELGQAGKCSPVLRFYWDFYWDTAESVKYSSVPIKSSIAKILFRNYWDIALESCKDSMKICWDTAEIILRYCWDIGRSIYIIQLLHNKNPINFETLYLSLYKGRICM